MCVKYIVAYGKADSKRLSGEWRVTSLRQASAQQASGGKESWIRRSCTSIGRIVERVATARGEEAKHGGLGAYESPSRLGAGKTILSWAAKPGAIIHEWRIWSRTLSERY